MDEQLENARRALVEGQRRSKQGSYERRSPSQEALPFLRRARAELTSYLDQHPACEEAWRMLSMAEECLLHYSDARWCFERGLKLGSKPDRKDLRRIALLKEYERKWLALGLTAAQLQLLGTFLEEELRRTSCDHSQKATRKWLEVIGVDRADELLKAMSDYGGHCDCEILANVVAG